MNRDRVWAIATGASADIAAIAMHLPESVRLYGLHELPAKRDPDIIVLDLLHPLASPSEVLGELERHASSVVILLSGAMEDLEAWPLSKVRVGRVIKHPAAAAGFKGVIEKILPFARKGETPAVVEAAGGKDAVRVLFSDGRTFNLPLKEIEGLDGTPIEKITVSKHGHEFTIVQASGHAAVVPWDSVLYRCDPGYEYYQRKRSPSLADLVAANIRTLRGKKGWTSYELADRTGIKRPNIARIENARTAPSLPTLEKIADALGIPVARLLE